MNWSDLLWRLRVVHGTGWAIYRADFPPGLLLLAIAPRVLGQALFFLLIAVMVTGEPSVASIGAIAMTTFTISQIGNVPLLDIISATLYRHRAGAVGVFRVLLARGVPYMCAGWAAFALTVGVLTPASGGGLSFDRLPAMLVVSSIIAVSSGLAGLTASIVSAPSRNDTLVTNLVSYAIIAVGGAVVPVERLGDLSSIGSILPMQHGISALRAIESARPWGHQALLELAVGGAWLVVGWCAVRFLTHRARTRGREDFA
ncbi:MAG: ABC transporter permease [Streptomyces sp.]|nr:ABC transporter permease [Streptomyces sp.]